MQRDNLLIGLINTRPSDDMRVDKTQVERRDREGDEYGAIDNTIIVG